MPWRGRVDCMHSLPKIATRVWTPRIWKWWNLPKPSRVSIVHSSSFTCPSWFSWCCCVPAAWLSAGWTPAPVVWTNAGRSCGLEPSHRFPAFQAVLGCCIRFDKLKDALTEQLPRGHTQRHSIGWKSSFLFGNLDEAANERAELARLLNKARTCFLHNTSLSSASGKDLVIPNFFNTKQFISVTFCHLNTISEDIFVGCFLTVTLRPPSLPRLWHFDCMPKN